MSAVWFLVLVTQFNLFSAINDGDLRVFNCEEAKNYPHCTNQKSGLGSAKICQGEKITDLAHSDSDDAYNTARKNACMMYGRASTRYTKGCKWNKERPICKKMWEPQNLLGNTFECGDGAQGGGGFGCSTKCVKQSETTECPVDSNGIGGAKLPTKQHIKWKIITGEECDTFTPLAGVSNGRIGCLSASLGNTGTLYKHIKIAFGNYLPCYFQRFEDSTSVWYLGRRRHCIASAHQEYENLLPAHEEYEDLLDDYFYDVAVEQAREERALRKLRRKKKTVLNAKNNLYYN